jgi:DNA-directed RNA polymerase subunit M/transcription elongation factor TFIIS
MYKIHAPLIHKTDENIHVIKKLFKEVLGYNEQEINQFVNTKFMCDIAINLTLEQAKQIAEPFYDYDINIYLCDQKTNSAVYWQKDLGINFVKNTPKSHYYDSPVVSRDHLVNPYTQKEKERQQNIQQNRVEQATKMYQNQPKCPTCQSTNISKIGTFGRMASVGFWGLASNKINKSFKCKNCGYTW